MKSYNKSLKEFIEYVFKKYKRDKSIQEFQSIYASREKQKEEQRELRKLTQKITKSVRVTRNTADICSKLVKSELLKNSILHQYTHEFVEQLELANNELTETLGVDNG